MSNAGRTKSAFAPRKHVLSRSERRQGAKVVLPADLQGLSRPRPVEVEHSATDAGLWIGSKLKKGPASARMGPFVCHGCVSRAEVGET